MSRRLVASIPIWIVVAALANPALAGESTVKRFYEAKQLSLTREAFARATTNLAEARVGMSEMEFLEAMDMEVLARGKSVQDARIDGYLPETSRRANNEADAGFRVLIFGYLEAGREVGRHEVTLREHVVHTVRPLAGTLTDVATANHPEPVS